MSASSNYTADQLGDVRLIHGHHVLGDGENCNPCRGINDHVARLRAQTANYAHQRDEARHERDKAQAALAETRTHLTEVEATRLNLEWRLGEAQAALADAKGVVTAAVAWRDWFPHADSMFAPENTLIAAVDAFKGKARVGASGAQASAIGLNELEHRLGPRIVALADEHSARVAADKRVLDAAEFAVARLREQFGRPDSDWFEDYTRELVAAVDARRALTGEQFEVSDKKRAEVEAELFRAGVHPGVESCTERNGFGRPCLLPKHGDERVCLFPGRAGVA